MKKVYLAYGSNLNLEQMGYRCPQAAVIGTTVLKNHRLIFKGSSANGVATIEKYKGSQVPVLLWEITEACEKALDRYEGYPHFYRKKIMRVPIDSVTLTAMVYIMNEGYPSALPGERYFSTILEGYHDCGFDDEILHKAVDATREALGH